MVKSFAKSSVLSRAAIFNPLARNLARAMASVGNCGKRLAGVKSGEGTLIGISTRRENVALDGTERNLHSAAALVTACACPVNIEDTQKPKRSPAPEALQQVMQKKVN